MTKKRTSSTSSSRSDFHKWIARNAHYVLLGALLLFVGAALILGDLLGMYGAVWWWDDMLHSASGAILGLVGLLTIYFLNARYNMAISPLLVGTFVFCFAVTLGVIWEIFEFVMDIVFQTAMQQWNLPQDAVVIGKEYQGMGLRDTMSDLILACAGSFGAAVFSHFMYKTQKPTVLSVMRNAFAWRAE